MSLCVYCKWSRVIVDIFFRSEHSSFRSQVLCWRKANERHTTLMLGSVFRRRMLLLILYVQALSKVTYAHSHTHIHIYSNTTNIFVFDNSTFVFFLPLRIRLAKMYTVRFESALGRTDFIRRSSDIHEFHRHIRRVSITLFKFLLHSQSDRNNTMWILTQNNMSSSMTLSCKLEFFLKRNIGHG